jgi:hypothetical protein
MAQRISLLTLGVRDLTTARHFYEHSLGWPPSPVSNEHVTFFHTDGMVPSHVHTASTMKVVPCITNTSPPLWGKDISTWRVSKGMGRPSRPRYGLLKTMVSCMSTPWRTLGK